MSSKSFNIDEMISGCHDEILNASLHNYMQDRAFHHGMYEESLQKTF